MCLVPNQGIANHIIAGFGSYAHIEDDSYEIKFTLFREASSDGPIFDEQIFVQIYTYDGIEYQYVRSRQILINEIKAVDFGVDNNIAQQNNIEIEVTDYTMKHDLLIPDVDYVFVFQRCCRSLTISNLLDPSQNGMSLMTHITRAARNKNNSSIDFDLYPGFFAHLNIGVVTNHAAINLDNDELVYEFSPVYYGAGTEGSVPPEDPRSCTGIAPSGPCPPPYQKVLFSFPEGDVETPFQYWENQNMNASSGIIEGTPKLKGQFSYGFSIHEYHNGQIINTTLFDYIIYVLEEPSLTVDQGLEELLIYPNPSDGNYTLSLAIEEKLNIKIFDLNSSEINFDYDPHSKVIRLAPELPPAVYYIKIQENNSFKTLRLIKF